MKALLRALAVLLLAASAQAHKASDAYLALTVDGARVTGRWDIALRDLELAIGLDANADGAITWGELRAARTAVDAYALSHLRIRAGDAPCSASVARHQIDRHTDGAYAVLTLAATCPREHGVALEYDLLFALDPQHRGLARVTRAGETRSAVLSPAQPHLALTGPANAWRTFADFAREGVWHIAIGADHILFLLCLLLPAVVRREAGRWHAEESARSAALDALRVVSAFTLAHSLTLALAALDVVALPSRLVESAIAASIVLAALDNLRPFLHAPRWAIALGFGLVHGLGFASVLADLGLPSGARVLALVAFNLGVELGQLAIVAAFLPLALTLRHSALYPRFALAGGSLAVAGLAGVWLWERALGA
jgi:hypothetical protein